MPQIELQQAYLDQGVEHVNFFNGRILTGEDLQDEQIANHREHRQLGTALGAGVVRGLDVSVLTPGGSGSSPVVRVDGGLALNGAGQGLELPAEVQINLLAQQALEGAANGLFAVCVPPQPGTLLVGTGAYVLLMSPASDYRGQAPKSGLGDGGTGSHCGLRHRVEGVRFRLIKLPVAELLSGLAGLNASDFVEPDASDTAGWSRLRGALAQLCLGTAETAPHDIDFSPASPPSGLGYGALGRLPESLLTDCDVPLALIYWTAEGIRFIDTWSVRRRPVTPAPAADWPTLLDPRFAVESEAVLLQFADQIAELRNDPAVDAGARVEDYLTHLPAVGYLPAGPNGFAWQSFLGAHAPSSETPIAQGLVRSVLATALPRLAPRVMPRNAPGAADATRYQVYRIDGRTDHVLIVRSGLAEIVARDVHFDNAGCQLPGVHTVQGALDDLCQRLRGCCTLVIAPGGNWRQAIDALSPGQDLSICFEVGHFVLTEPLRFSGLGHVKVCGGGPGTRLTIANRESALVFENCASVQVSDLSAQAGTASPPQGSGANRRFQSLAGVLSVHDCPSVDVERVRLRCASATRRAASCLYVRHDTAAGGQSDSTRVRGCECLVGSGQVGILAVNADRCQIEDNQVRLDGSPGPGTAPAGQGIVVAGRIAGEVRVRDNNLRDLVQGIHVGVSHRESSRGTPDSIRRVVIAGNAIEVALDPSVRGERHAIFVGNCLSLAVDDNRANLQRIGGANQSIEGLRLFGTFGRRLLVRGNQLDQFNTGILIHSLTLPPTNPLLQWVVEDNLLTSAGQAVRVEPTALRSRVRNIGNNVA
jgi:hypothetical protein